MDQNTTGNEKGNPNIRKANHSGYYFGEKIKIFHISKNSYKTKFHIILELH